MTKGLFLYAGVFPEDIFFCVRESGTDISTSPLAAASEFLKKGLSGKYVLVFTCPNGQADFLNIKHIFYSKWPQIPRNMQTMQQN